MPSTKIVCTIGPASQSETILERLILAGMNVARLNFSHGTHADHAEVIARIRALSTRLGKPVAILQDLQGPKIRTGALQQHAPVLLVPGATVTLTTRPLLGDATLLSTTYQQLPQDVKPGDHLFLADGIVELAVVATTTTEVQCHVLHGGMLGEHKGINLPGVSLSAEALTEKDRADLRFGVAQGVDFIALSFVRHPADLQVARQAILEASAATAPHTPPGAQHASSYIASDGSQSLPPLIAKLEKPEAIEHLDAILQAADGVMIARGDLGVELPLEQVPLLQKRIISHANALGIPVITATQMLESMVSQPRPTRAEASDVANAILDGTDAIMLSEETASGQYPVEAVEMMVRIARATEPACQPQSEIRHQQKPAAAQAVSRAAHILAQEAGAQAIVVFTRSGRSGELISKERPHVPIIAYTPFEAIYRQLALWWGIMPRLFPVVENTETLIAQASQRLVEDGFVQKGEMVVMMGGMPVTGQAQTNFLKLHHI